MSIEEIQTAWGVDEWYGQMLVDCEGEKIGKLRDVYVDSESGEPRFASVRGGFVNRRLTFVPLRGIQAGPEDLRLIVTKAEIASLPEIDMYDDELSQEDAEVLYCHFGQVNGQIGTAGDRCLIRR